MAVIDVPLFGSWSLCLAAGSFICLIAYAIYNRYLNPLAKVPGPIWASITPLWLAWQMYNQRRPRLDIDLHKQYGKFKAVHGAGSKFAKGAYYDTITSGVKEWSQLDLVAERNFEKLRLQKRHTGTVYTIANVKKHEDLVDTTIESWFGRLRKLSGSVMDFNYEINLLLVDNQTRVTFGHAYGAIEKGWDDDSVHRLGKIWRWWAWTSQMPWLSKIDKRISPWREALADRSWDPVPMMTFAKTNAAKVMELPSDTKKPPGLLNDLLHLCVAQPHFLPTWAAAMAATNIGAGTDTTAWTLATVVATIAGDKQVLQKVQAEIRTAVDEGEMTPGVPVPYDAAVKLTYLQSCIQEAMRILPSVDGLVRVVPAGGMTIDGYWIPAGTEITISSRVLGRNQEIFGASPNEFQPERWLTSDKKKLHNMTERNLSFGGPSRKCPGMHLAWVGVSKILASFFLNFDVELLNELDGVPGPGGRSWRECGKFITVWEGMEVRITPRNTTD